MVPFNNLGVRFETPPNGGTEPHPPKTDPNLSELRKPSPGIISYPRPVQIKPMLVCSLHRKVKSRSSWYTECSARPLPIVHHGSCCCCYMSRTRYTAVSAYIQQCRTQQEQLLQCAHSIVSLAARACIRERHHHSLLIGPRRGCWYRYAIVCWGFPFLVTTITRMYVRITGQV